ncbi:hypothetical protein BGZ70_007134 [Mortierella alpina]|uniref:Zn(2)-C6 fungal-type domain-containing protein n=1 Tax=Mortierella alpina TaxID=64518 RepID=A0A9P6JDP0_MORAP|nr:hypothetical protein BGZ70_007134 [Mortierella alpina]
MDYSLASSSAGSKKQKTTPPCDRCRQRRIKCDRLEPTCSSCIKYKATCVRTAVPAGAPLSTVSVEAIGGHGLRVMTSSGKRDRHLSETEVLDSCLRDVQSLQLNRLHRIEKFFDRLGIDETRLDEVSWLAEQLKVQQESMGSHDDLNYRPEESSPLLPNVMGAPLKATLSESGEFICPAPKPAPFPTRVPQSVLNKTMFELSVYDRTEYLGPVAGTRASSWSEEMRFPLPWLVPEPQVDESLLELPPMEHMLLLIEWMIQSPMYTYFPILTKASILNALSTAIPNSDGLPSDIRKTFASSNIEDDSGPLPQRITGRVSAVFLLNAIMALALTVYVLDQPRVSSLQGLLLLMKCPAIPGIQNLYREQACAMALSLGLHRDCEPWTLCRSVIQLRRNIFWCCYVIDASYSLNSGSPERFPDDYISVGLPELPSIDLGDDIGEIEAENEVRRIGFLTEQAKLWRIVKKIRRCGQTSNKNVDGYCEASTVFRNPESGAPSSLYTLPETPSTASSPVYGLPNNELHGQNAGSKTPPASPAQPSWVWRADSARRILDVELAQWQMELPSHLRFDFALTRKDDPCPFEVRVNGLGAMLQLIFNEVLILLHHPFLILADTQSQHRRDSGMHPSLRQAKPRSGSSATKSPRSRRSSSTSKSSGILSNGAQGDDNISLASRSLPPFLNSCTKAAEAITFLVDHLLRTTPEWLVCHNEAESALHIAERVHALNVTISESQSSAVAASSLPGSTAQISSINGAQARCQLKKTKAFRKKITELDQFTMSDGFRPDLMTKELTARGSARERLMRCMRRLLAHKRGVDYYRLPRSPPEMDVSAQSDGQSDQNSQDQELAETGTGQDHLEMRLAFLNDRLWIRYYNIRIKDGVESKNGAESWQEVLNPYVPPAAPESDSDDDEDPQQLYGSHPFEYSSDDMAMVMLDDGMSPAKQGPQRRRTESGSDIFDGVPDSLDPHQKSSMALMQVFSNPNPTGIVNFTDMVEGSAYYPNQQAFANKKDFGKDYGVIEPGYDTPIYFTGQYAQQEVPLDSFDRLGSPMSLDNAYQQEHQARGFRIGGHDGSVRHEHEMQQHQQQQQQQQQHNTPYSQASYQSTVQHHPHPLQQNHNGFSGFGLHNSATMNFDQAVVSPSYSAPESPNRSAIATTTEATMSLGLLSVSTPLIPSNMTFDGGPYLNLLHQQFPNQHIPTQPHGASSMQQYQQQQQTLDASLSGAHPAVRPFYGMPMGGFMAPSLDALPVISRNTHVQQQQHRTSAAPATPTTGPIASTFLPKSESLSPPLPPSLVSSVPTSPMPQSTFRMVLSPTMDPTMDALQGISNRLNAWDGLAPKTDSSDLNPSPSPFQSQAAAATLSSHHNGSHYAHSWSSTSSTSELMSNNGSTSGSTVLRENSASPAGVFGDINKSTAMDVEVGSSSVSSAGLLSTSGGSGHHQHPHHQHPHLHHQHQHPVSAVPEAPFGDYATSHPDDPVRFFLKKALV